VTHATTVAELLDQHGQTFAAEAGIRLADQPSPLYQLLVLTELLSTRISSGIAVAAARELFAAGYRTPERMLKASWQARVDALGRGHYKRYDESTATRLGEGARLLIDRWDGDLRALREEAGHEPDRIHALLQEFAGIGPTGASIFLREVQGVWTDLRPYVDDRVLQAAQRLDLPASPEGLAHLVAPEQLPQLAAALIRRKA
jgi:endonuclease III